MNIENEIIKLQKRNERVESDKAWETSIFRISLICFITYITTVAVFAAIGVQNYLANALIPTLGFFLSTQSLPWMKKWWIDRRL
jgi:hypothetical protein